MTNTSSQTTRRFAPKQRRAILGAAAGNAIEFYDFAVYGFLAVYIGQHFFPTGDSTTELLSTFAVFGLAFVARPVGSVIFGPLADRIGRKPVLVMVLFGIAGASALMGCLPTYQDIGVAAPVLMVLLRFVQGLSAGGEYGSGTTFILESSPRAHRGLGVSWLTVSTTVGILGGIATVTILTAALGESGMYDWGWRVPFLIALPLGIVGWYIRQRIEETPEFQVLDAEGDKARAPFRDALKMWPNMLIIFGVGAFHATAYYSVFTYMPTYISVEAGHGQTLSLVSSFVTGVFAIIALPLMASLSDRIGRRPVLLIGGGAFLALVWPVYALIPVVDGALVVVLHIVLGVAMATSLASSAVAMGELFPARVRTSGMSFGYALPAAIFGGGAPFVGTFLIAQTGLTTSASWYLIVTAVIGLAAALCMKPHHLHDDSEIIPIGQTTNIPAADAAPPSGR